METGRRVPVAGTGCRLEPRRRRERRRGEPRDEGEAPGERGEAPHLQTGVPRRQHTAVRGPLDASEVLRVGVEVLPWGHRREGPGSDSRARGPGAAPRSRPAVPARHPAVKSWAAPRLGGSRTWPPSTLGGAWSAPAACPPPFPRLTWLRADEAPCAPTAFQRLLCLSPAHLPRGAGPRTPGPWAPWGALTRPDTPQH